jgi:hypothetical protein
VCGEYFEGKTDFVLHLKSHDMQEFAFVNGIAGAVVVANNDSSSSATSLLTDDKTSTTSMVNL